MQMNERVKGIHLGKYWLIVDKNNGVSDRKLDIDGEAKVSLLVLVKLHITKTKAKSGITTWKH